MAEQRTFPIQGEDHDASGKAVRPIGAMPATSIPWWLAEIAYSEYSRRFGTGQSLERLAERGGFGRWELLSLLAPECHRVSLMIFP